MPKGHDEAQGLTASVHGTARKRMLAALSNRLGELDAIYGQDAAAIKAAIAAMLRLSGISEKRVGDAVNRVIAASRDKRFGVLESAVKDGAIAGNVDRATYRAVFNEEMPEADLPPPKAPGASASQPKTMPSLRLVNGSEDGSPETS